MKIDILCESQQEVKNSDQSAVYISLSTVKWNNLNDSLTGDWFILGTVIGENGDGPVETAPTCCGIGRTRWEGVGHPGEVT